MELTRTQKFIIGFIGGFLLGLGLIWGWNNYTSRTTINTPAATTTPDSMPATETSASSAANNIIGEQEVAEHTLNSDHITVQNQPAGNTVLVDTLVLTAPGWAVVHEENNGFIGNALGAARRNAGTYTNTTISLLRSTEPGKRYWVVLYGDNGDRLFNLHDDFPVRTSAGDPIMSPFMAE